MAAPIVRCVMVVCKAPLNRLVLGLLGVEIEKYTRAGEEVMLSFFYSAQAEAAEREKFRIRNLAGEFGKAAANQLRNSPVQWSTLKNEGVSNLGCGEGRVFFCESDPGTPLLDNAVGCIVSLFGLVEAKGQEEKKMAQMQTPKDQCASQMHDVVKKICKDTKKVGTSALADVDIRYRILSAGAVDGGDSMKYADAFRRELTVYDISGTSAARTRIGEFMEKLRAAEKDLVEKGRLDGFADLEQDIFVSSVHPEVQASFYSQMVRENPPSANFGLSRGLGQYLFPPAYYPFAHGF